MLPRLQSDAGLSEQAHTHPFRASGRIPMSVPRKLLLVVEDNPIDREWLRLVLDRAGHDVIVAGHGDQALDQLAAGLKPDLIVLDMMLPVLDGWHFLELIKNN